MKYDPPRHHRRAIRLRGYDYAQAGAYFVTICTRERECLFGEIVGGQMRWNAYGQVVHREWIRSAEIRDEIDLDAFVVMPNHLHGIVVITDEGSTCGCGDVGAHGRAPLRESPSQRHRESPHRPPRSLGSLIAGFKSATTKRINAMRGTPGMPVWQRNYYEHIIRNEREFDRIRRYIVENPARWAEDRENPANLSDPSGKAREPAEDGR